MPWYWRAAHYVFPAAPGTLAFVKVNSMGASMADIRAEYVTLWVQCAVYFALACMAYRYNVIRALRRVPAAAAPPLGRISIFPLWRNPSFRPGGSREMPF